MIAKNISEAEMTEALKRVNKKFDGNIIFNRFERQGKNILFTLRVKSSKGPGHRLGQCMNHEGNRKRLTAACWGVHGTFFEKALEIQASARFFSSRTGWIDKEGGNWQDFEIGSIMNPLSMSEACGCEHH